MHPDDLKDYIDFATRCWNVQYSDDESDNYLPIMTASTSGDAASSATSYTDPHAVSEDEAEFYYAGLHSRPHLLYRTGKEPWSPPRGPEAYCRLKELCEVFNHPIVDVWNRNLGWKVVKVLDAHTVS